jgi:hypothetical protein
MAKTKVIFRRFKDDGTIIALFPDQLWNSTHIASYQHAGQHGPAEYIGLLQVTKLAKPGEYAALARELTSIGYELDIRTRR